MSYSIYSKEKKSLQFPAFCDGYLQLDYSDAIAIQKTGLWGNAGSFTLQTIVTPYDVNGNIRAAVLNKKILNRTATYDTAYFPASDRTDSKMTLISNANIKVSLNNTTTNANDQPAEYAISFTLKIGGTSTTITSDTVITSTPITKYARTGNNKHLYNNHQAFAKKVLNPDGSAFTISGIDTVNKRFVIPSGAQQSFYTGQPLYSQLNEYLGTTQGGIGTTITMSDRVPSTLTEVYENVKREALYLNVPHHIAVSYDKVNSIMYIIYNNEVVASGKHSVGGDFIFGASDITFGQDIITAGTGLVRESQFYGEMHEICITSVSETSFSNTNTLVPMFKRLLFYLDFREDD